MRDDASKFEKGDGQFGTLSYEKMMHEVNEKHPRLNGELVPLSIPTGTLPFKKTDKIDNFDVHGIGVSIYFKLLKSFIKFMTWCLIINIPLMYIYS